MVRSFVVVVLAASGFVALGAGCDSKATASDPLAGGGGRGEPRSKEYETCSASALCGDDQRCFDHTCRRTNRSTVGDWYAARGALLRSRGDSEASIAAYTQALHAYDTEKLALPPDLDCAYGSALANAKGQREHAELGARILHRCLLAVPVGSTLRERALADLAVLGDSGLDPSSLAKPATADVYLTRDAARPATDKLTISATGSPAIPDKSNQLIVAKLGEADLKGALIACWDAYNQATKKDALTVSVTLKNSYQASIYADDPDASGSYAFKLDPATGVAAGADTTADSCVRAAVEPAFKALPFRDQFSSKLAISIK